MAYLGPPEGVGSKGALDGAVCYEVQDKDGVLEQDKHVPPQRPEPAPVCQRHGIGACTRGASYQHPTACFNNVADCTCQRLLPAAPHQSRHRGASFQHSSARLSNATISLASPYQRLHASSAASESAHQGLQSQHKGRLLQLHCNDHHWPYRTDC